MDLILHIIIIISMIDLVNVFAIGLIFYFLGNFVFLVRVDLWSFASFGVENLSFLGKGILRVDAEPFGTCWFDEQPIFFGAVKNLFIVVVI